MTGTGFGGELSPGRDLLVALLARNWWAIGVRGVLAIVFGLIALFLPGATMLSLVIVFAIYAFVDGVFGIVSGGSSGAGRPTLGAARVRGPRQHRRRRDRRPLAGNHGGRVRAARRSLGDPHRGPGAGGGVSARNRRRSLVAGRRRTSPRWSTARCLSSRR